MSPPPAPLLQDATLRAVTRRYRVPAISHIPSDDAFPATALAVAVEHARRALAAGSAPPPGIRRTFLDALARLIREALSEEYGDPVFQAMLLRHRIPRVREYASLSAGAAQDRREVVAAVNAISHPAKLERMPPGPARDVRARLQEAVAAHDWAQLEQAARSLLDSPAIPEEASAVSRLGDSAALDRLLRLDALAADGNVRRYRALWEQQGPRPGSAAAVAQGNASRQRGAAVEALALQALEALARRLNGGPARGSYQAVSSMRVPASIPGSADRAKSEWDAALLRRAESGPALAPDVKRDAPAWDLCLLLEAKASADAAGTDFPRLLRGLELLAQADATETYSFSSRQGAFALRGASLRALPTSGPDLEKTVLYFCDAPAETMPRLLSAASRMQFLSADASLAYASELAQGQDPAAHTLEAVWLQLLESPKWAGVLQQYPLLCQARELMVHVDDLMAAIEAAPHHSAASTPP